MRARRGIVRNPAVTVLGCPDHRIGTCITPNWQDSQSDHHRRCAGRRHRRAGIPPIITTKSKRLVLRNCASAVRPPDSGRVGDSERVGDVFIASGGQLGVPRQRERSSESLVNVDSRSGEPQAEGR
jgi:hypothetical protein